MSAPIFDAEYGYFSSFSDTMLKHAERYVEMMVPRFGLQSRSRVVELASNDGYLLQYFKRAGIQVLGIEPTANTAAAAIRNGIPTLTEFFGRDTAREVRANNGAADLLLGNNVLAQVPDINDFMRHDRAAAYIAYPLGFNDAMVKLVFSTAELVTERDTGMGQYLTYTSKLAAVRTRVSYKF